MSDHLQRKEMRELRIEIRFLHALLDALDDPVFVKDEEHRWVLLNEAAANLIGRPREELLGKTDLDVSPPDEANVFWKEDEQVLRSGDTRVNEEVHTSARGAVTVLSTKKSRMTDSHTGKRYVVGTIRDITARRRIEDELNQQIEEYRVELQRVQEAHDALHAQIIATLDDIMVALQRGAPPEDAIDLLADARARLIGDY